ncbi:MAG: hypothetical protein ACI4EA_04675 [Candidatus Ornithomonoglobus sp.]
MTTDEKLDLLLDKFSKFETRLDRLENDVSDLKNDVSDLKNDVSALKVDVSVLKVDVSGLKNDVSDLKTAQLQTTAKLDGTIDKCIQVLYESHTLNSERLDKFDIEAIKRNTDIAVTMAKMAYDAVMKKAI